MKTPFNDTELEAYLDEALPPEAMAAIENALRQAPDLSRRLAAINARRDGGIHSLGDIWRRHRLTCPTRAELGSYLLGVLPDGQAAYIAFHLDEIGCRYCQANRADLEEQQTGAGESRKHRRLKYFESSAGYLRRE